MNHPAWQQAVLQILVPLLPAQEARARAGPQATVGSPGPQKQMEAVGRPRAGRVAFTSQLVWSCIPELGGDGAEPQGQWLASTSGVPARLPGPVGASWGLSSLQAAPELPLCSRSTGGPSLALPHPEAPIPVWPSL